MSLIVKTIELVEHELKEEMWPTRDKPKITLETGFSLMAKPDSRKGTFKWPNLANRTLVISAASADAEFVVKILYKLFNKAPSVFHRPGLNDWRIILKDRFRGISATMNSTYTPIMGQKHKAFVSCAA